MATVKLKWPDSIPRTQFNEQFLQGMLDRMAFGYHNYGPVQRSFPEHYNAIKSLRQRLKKYRETGNTEWLMDVGNYAMIEFAHPRHKKAHFRPTEKKESPGATLNDGRVAKGKEDYDYDKGDKQRVNTIKRSTR